MSRKTWIIILVVIGVLCIGGALWYPISYQMQRNEQQEQLDELRSLRGTAGSSGGNGSGGNDFCRDRNG